MSQFQMENDAVLLEKISRGDAQSFNVLYKKHWQAVYNYAYKRLSDQSEAEDITQEIFCKIWLNRNSQSINDLPAYLYTAVRNKVLNLFEKEKRFAPVKSLLDKAFTAEQADYLALQNEFLSAYEALVESLPTKRKTIFYQHFELGKSTKEIAKQLSLSPKTVQNQLRRATNFLIAELSNLLLLAILFLF